MKLKVTATPNPFTHELFVLLHGSFEINVVIRLINSRGTVIRTTGTTLKTGDNKIKIDNLRQYASGQYQLEIKLLTGDLVETINLKKILPSRIITP